ncbi:molybdopterin molybdenumtransferase MoeA [Paenarthrobacter nitroguajacolicus]|uniref:molybdopterin molybdotransferase MoeA n=1 Tax=Paenarthrobacter nitroguajacolicus TaxID=211146 RepID=UPI001C4AB6C7|nr:molybdopterin molybdotransferase MoeA [Paenarthrobacter nitroguajacolicus]NWL10387.1 molybdopterin molybdenumtransferase MoeA [Paenarthrobacter nitroguajacolicus]
MPQQKIDIGIYRPSTFEGLGVTTSWWAARQIAFDYPAPLASIALPLTNAVGFTLKSDVDALQDLPHYAASAMDGWSVSGSGPWLLVPHVPGQGGITELEEGQAVAVLTGGLIPKGATAVLREESGQILEGAASVRHLSLRPEAKLGETLPGSHIRPAGEESHAGEVLIPAGTVLTPAHVALAAAAGHNELQVQNKPTVDFVHTGSELLTSGRPGPGQFRDTIGPALGSVISQLGGIPKGQLHIGDSYDDWLSALSGSADGRNSDVTITTGGTSRSATDHLRTAITDLGGNLLIDGIAMRPGHPAVLAELPGGRLIVGLPGNPLAAMVALITLAEPLLAALANKPFRPADLVASGKDLDPLPGQTRLVPCSLVQKQAMPTSYTGSGMMRGLAQADGLMVVPPNGIRAGGLVPVLLLPWTSTQFQ